MGNGFSRKCQCCLDISWPKKNHRGCWLVILNQSIRFEKCKPKLYPETDWKWFCCSMSLALTFELMTWKRIGVRVVYWSCPSSLTSLRCLGPSVHHILSRNSFAVQCLCGTDLWDSVPCLPPIWSWLTCLSIKFDELWLKHSPDIDQKQSVYWQADGPTNQHVQSYMLSHLDGSGGVGWGDVTVTSTKTYYWQIEEYNFKLAIFKWTINNWKLSNILRKCNKLKLYWVFGNKQMFWNLLASVREQASTWS